MSISAQLIILSVLIIQSQSLILKKSYYDENYLNGNGNVYTPNDVIRLQWERVDNNIKWKDDLKDERTEEYKKIKQAVEKKVSEIKQLIRPLNLNPKFEKTENNKVKITVILVLTPEWEPRGQRRYKRESVEDYLKSLGGTLSSPGEIDDTCKNDGDCKVEHTKCVFVGSQGYCKCKDGYVHEDGVKNKCYPVRALGEPCDIPKQCEGDAQTCGNPSKKCECRAGAIQDNNKCYPVRQKLHEICARDDQCAIRNSACTGGFCKCSGGFVESKEKPNTCYDPNAPARKECGSQPNLVCVTKESCNAEHEMKNYDCPQKNDVCCDKCETKEPQEDSTSSCIPQHECPYPYRKKGHCDKEGENCCRTCERYPKFDCIPSGDCPVHLQVNMYCGYKTDVCCRTCARLGGHCVPKSRCPSKNQDKKGSYCPQKNHVCCINK